MIKALGQEIAVMISKVDMFSMQCTVYFFDVRKQLLFYFEELVQLFLMEWA